MEILGIPWAIAIIWAGAAGASWWWTLLFGAIGLVLYAWPRMNSMIGIAQRNGFLTTLPLFFLAQMVMVVILFGIGVGLGSIL